MRRSRWRSARRATFARLVVIVRNCTSHDAVRYKPVSRSFVPSELAPILGVVLHEVGHHTAVDAVDQHEAA